ncbi:motor neuron and pancreas homeobox protein 1 [Eucalyptus grandis]|uniref:motor neuron and pancreas homeobox protein 1 n=1 Tax=Eucalyptus grandis TaxID=71139 RepID=UPI00192E7D8C|nr:motor neuron and pancreas homeobox protein 1 [Eucalyptus grandis]
MDPGANDGDLGMGIWVLGLASVDLGWDNVESDKGGRRTTGGEEEAVGAVRGGDQGPEEEEPGVARHLRHRRGGRPRLRLRRPRLPRLQGQDQLPLPSERPVLLLAGAAGGGAGARAGGGGKGCNSRSPSQSSTVESSGHDPAAAAAAAPMVDFSAQLDLNLAYHHGGGGGGAGAGAGAGGAVGFRFPHQVAAAGPYGPFYMEAMAARAGAMNNQLYQRIIFDRRAADGSRSDSDSCSVVVDASDRGQKPAARVLDLDLNEPPPPESA